MRPLYTKFSLVFLFFLLFGNSLVAVGFTVADNLVTKDKTKEVNNPTRPRTEIGGKNDRPKKTELLPVSTKAKRKVAKVPPTIFNEDTKTPSLTPLLLTRKGTQPIATNFNRMAGPDPFIFTITSTKDSVVLGEEFELIVRVDFADFGTTQFFLPEWYKYTLKVVMPKGFTQTGGDYTDFCTKPVSAQNPQAIFTIKGKFEYKPEEAKFMILRGFEGADEKSDFFLKGERSIILNIKKNSFRVAAREEYQFLNISKTKCGNERFISGEIKYTGLIKENNRNIDVAYHVDGECNDNSTPYYLPPSISNPTVTVSLNSANTATFLIQFNNSSFPVAFNVFNGTTEGANHLDIKSFFELNNNVYCNIAGNNLPVTIYETPVATRTGYNTLSVTGCVYPSIITWDNGAGNGSPVNPTPNITTTYKAKCTTNGCVSAWSNSVTVSCTPTIPTVTNNQSVCFGTGVSFTSTSGHTYILEWQSPGGNFTNLLSYPHITGHYRIKATGCSGTEFGYSNEFDVTVNVIPSTPTVITPVDYIVGQTPSSLSTKAIPSSGGTLYWYSTATGGTGTIIAPTPSTATAGTTNYYVSQTKDACESNRVAVTVIVTEIVTPNLAVPTINPSNNPCSVLLTANTSETLVSYQWSKLIGDQQGYSDIIGATSSTYTPTEIGSYKVRISKANYNSATSAAQNVISLTNVTAPAGTSVSPTSITEGTSTTVTIGGTCVASEGSTLQWSSDNGVSWTTGNATISTATTFNFRCRVNVNCISALGIPRNTTTNNSVSVTTVPSNASNCGSSDGSITCTASGGSGSGYQYILYANDGTTVVRDYQTGSTFSLLATGTYKIKAKDSNNLVSSLFSTATIAATNGVTAPSSTSATPASITEDVNTIITLGGTCTSGSTLEWSLNDGISWNTDATTNINTSKTFKFRCKVSATCVSPEGTSRTVNTYGGVQATATSSNTSNCSSTDGSVTASATGGTGIGYQYALYNESGLTELRPYQTSGIFSNLSNGTYKIKVKDGAGTIASLLAEATVASPDAPTSPILTEYSKTINSGDNYNLIFPANACPPGSTPDWITNFTNPISTAGEYKGVCTIGGCSSSPSTFTLSVNGRTTTINSINPNCFNSGGNVTASITGTGDYYFSLYNVGTGNFVSGQTDKYAGVSYTFTGVTEGTYKVYIRPQSSTSTFTTDNITLTKNCTGGYVISDVVLANCFGKDASFKVSVTNPTAGIGYIYSLIDVSTNQVVQNQAGGHSYIYTNVSKGIYRVDIQEDKIGGGVINGNQTVNLENEACANQGIILSNPVKASCLGTNGGFTVSVSKPTAGIGYIYILVNATTGQQVGTPKAGGHSYTFTGIADGTYSVNVYEDKIGGGVVNGNEQITIEKDCSIIIAELIKEGTLNCANDGGDVSLKIVSTVKAGIQQDGMFKYNLYEPTYSDLGTQGYRAVAQVTTWITNSTVFPVMGPDNAWKLIDRNTWIVYKIQKTIGSAYTPIIAGNYFGNVIYMYYPNGVETETVGTTNTIKIENNFVVTATPTGSVCGRSDGKVKLNFTCGLGKYNIFFYSDLQNDALQVIGTFPNFFQGTDYTFNNLPPGRYHAIIFEKNAQGNGTRTLEVENIIVPQLSIPITITPAESADFCPESTVTLGISNAPVGSTYLWTGVPASQQTLANPVVTMPTTPGDYQFIARVTLGACNSGNVVRELTVRVPPVITITSNSPDDGIGTIETGDSLKVDVAEVTGSTRTYQWKYDPITVDTNGTAITQTTRNIKFLNVLPSQSGYYKVKVTDQFGCINYNKTKVLIKPFQCKLTAQVTPTCYIETNKRWAKMQVVVQNRTLNWRGFIRVTRVQDADSVAVTGENPIIDTLWSSANTKSMTIGLRDKIPFGIYQVVMKEKRSDEESGPGFECFPDTMKVMVDCRRKCQAPANYANCGKVPTPDLSQEIFKDSLKVGDSFFVGDFEIVVDAVTQTAPYTFKGKGYIKMPYLNFVKVQMDFDSTKINECKYLVAGAAKTVYDPDWGAIVNPEAAYDDAVKLYKEMKDLTKSLIDLNFGTLDERRAKAMSKQMVSSENDLPKALVDEKNKNAAQLKDIQKKCNNGTFTAIQCTAAGDSLKKDQKALQDKIDKYKDDWIRIVTATLTQIQTTAKANKTTLLNARNAKALVIDPAFNPASDGSLAKSLPNAIFAQGTTTTSKITDTKTLNYYNAEIAYNESLIQDYFSEQVKSSRAEAIALAKRLKLAGNTQVMADYIYAELSKSPVTPDATIITAIKPIFLEDIKKILIQKVYGK